MSNLKNEGLRLKFLQLLNKEVALNGNYSKGRCVISVSSQEQDAILDELSFLLTSIGLDNYGEVNEKGLDIEGMIDLFLKN